MTFVPNEIRTQDFNKLWMQTYVRNEYLMEFSICYITWRKLNKCHGYLSVGGVVSIAKIFSPCELNCGCSHNHSAIISFSNIKSYRMSLRSTVYNKFYYCSALNQSQFKKIYCRSCFYWNEISNYWHMIRLMLHLQSSCADIQKDTLSSESLCVWHSYSELEMTISLFFFLHFDRYGLSMHTIVVFVYLFVCSVAHPFVLP